VILLVTYDLKQPPASYSDLFDELKARENWWHYISSTWLVATHETPKELSKALRLHVFEGDRILVTEFGDYSGWLPRKAWNWIKQHRTDRENDG
jgi:hypothetical protein